MEDEDKMLPDWLREVKMRNIPADYINKFKEDTLLKYENEIDRLTKKCNELRKYEIELLRKIEELEKQIEMMRNCENCGNSNFGENCKKCNTYDKWEMRR